MDAAPLIDILTAGLGVITRSRDYQLLDLEVVKQVLARSPDQVSTHPESGMLRLPSHPLDPDRTQRALGSGYPCRYLLFPKNRRRAGRYRLRALCQHAPLACF